jgi:two-component system nitrogen regulation sensor histidine kinase NtrY
MSHEVNNTIGAVQSLLQSCLAFRRQLDDPDRAEFSRALEVAISRTANLGEFTSRFAEVVRLPGPRHRPADPWKIASQVGRLFRDRCEAAGVAWREEVPGGLPPVHCDPVQLEQVLVNVVKNAVEAMEEAPVSAGDRGGRDRPREIVLRGGRQGRRPFLAIRDTGPGLTEETAARLFTPFFTTREKGQGIGLTMVQEILLAHGFDFSLQNGDCQGAEFTIVF